MTPDEFKKFCDRYMCQGGSLVAGRLQAALALIERLRTHPSFVLKDHLSGGGASLESHETFGKAAHERFDLEPINKNHGRRSSNVADWGQPLLDLARAAGAGQAGGKAIDAVQTHFAQTLRTILESEPITVRVKGRSAESVIADVLAKAEERGKAGAVAQYLVGAKLQLRYPDLKLPMHAYNKGDRRRRGDEDARLGDFEFEGTVIEVALGTPDEKHVEQVEEAVAASEVEVWLLVRAHRLKAWQDEIKELESSLRQRIVVASVEAFVGQNVTELGNFSPVGKLAKLDGLFSLYNEQWIKKLGPQSLRIVVK